MVSSYPQFGTNVPRVFSTESLVFPPKKTKLFQVKHRFLYISTLAESVLELPGVDVGPKW